MTSPAALTRADPDAASRKDRLAASEDELAHIVSQLTDRRNGHVLAAAAYVDQAVRATVPAKVQAYRQTAALARARAFAVTLAIEATRTALRMMGEESHGNTRTTQPEGLRGPTAADVPSGQS